jgi:CheY-like chemotaxis protein
MARVLIVDDSADMLSLLRMFFERRTNHEVILTKNGQEGLEKAYEEQPDIALVDVMMPGMDGYEVVRRLRADARTKRMHIIILTARGQPVDREAALEAGADAHLTKPVNMEALEQLIDDLLSSTPRVEMPKSAVIPVLSLRGGIGVSTVAVNLAVVLQELAPTILWDLSPNSGHSATYLGLRPTTHWGTYLEDRNQPLKALLLDHQSGIRVLCAPAVPPLGRWFTESEMGACLDALTNAARLIVIDMPPKLTDSEMPLLDRAHRIVLLTGDDPPSIQTTLATLKSLQRWRDRILIVHNVTSSGKRPSAEVLQRMMRVPVKVDLPYEPTQQKVIRSGSPLALRQPQGSFVAQIKRVAQLTLGRVL